MKKTVFVTGGTGFVGRTLVMTLLGAGHAVRVWTRSPARARAALSEDVEYVQASDEGSAMSAALLGVDAIVNLAGEPIFEGRWSKTRRRKLVESRVALTKQIVEAVKKIEDGPKVLVSASAVGYYGDRGDEEVDETSDPGDDFLAELCQSWEEAANEGSNDLRVATLRIGIVLGREGGALGKMLPIFRVGGGGRLGSGKQYMPWIHLTDLTKLIMTALEDDRYVGPINAVGPRPVTNREFTKALATALDVPAVLPAPGIALRLMLGESATALLGGQRVLARRTEELGFDYEFVTVDEALLDIVAEDRGVTFSGPINAPDVPYIEARGVTDLMTQRTVIDAPLDKVFAFFSKPTNLGAMTPQAMRFEIKNPGEEMAVGAHLEHRVQIGPFPLNWVSKIEAWEPGHRFVDSQIKGPYKAWWHEHQFEAKGDRTIMIDRVYFKAPFGVFGRMANRMFIKPMLRRIFGYRSDITAARFQSSSQWDDTRIRHAS